MIECIRTYHLEHSLSEPFGFSQWYYGLRKALLVEVIDDSGAVGWGECYGPAEVTQAGIESFYTPMLLGRDPLANEAAWQHCWQRSVDFARRGVLMGALSGLDMALFDLKGKLLGVSAAELMGGRVRDQVRCYATGMYFREIEDGALIEQILEEAAQHVEAGYRALKIKVGRNPDFDADLITAMRVSFPVMQLMADANHAFDLQEAQSIGELLADEGYAWFEEPLSPELSTQYRQLSDSVRVPIAAGECEQTRWGFQELLSKGGVQFAQPDLAYCGGPSEGLKIRSLASSMGVNVVPHCWGTQLNLACSVHFIASTFVEPGRGVSGEPLLEHDRTENPMRDDIFASAVCIQNGLAEVPSTPGLGVEPDRNAMNKLCRRSTENQR